MVVLPPSVMTTTTNENCEEEELLFLSAGGTDIHLWNGISIKKISSVSSHAKNITTLYLVTPQKIGVNFDCHVLSGTVQLLLYGPQKGQSIVDIEVLRHIGFVVRDYAGTSPIVTLNPDLHLSIL